MSLDASFRAQVQAFSTKQGVEASFVEATRQEGLFSGQKVVVVDARSLLAEAAEEMTFALSEKVEKKLSERNAGSKTHLRASATEVAERFVNLMADAQSGRKLHEFMDALMGKGDPTEADVRQLVSKFFDDASDQFAALSYAEEMLSTEGGHEPLLASVRGAKAALLEQAGEAIRAGLNAASEAMRFAKAGLEGAEALRDLYRFAVLGGQAVTQLYDAIMERYGPSRFGKTLEFLLRAAGSDLDGREIASSVEPARLQAAIDDIFHVQSLGNLHRSLGEVLDNTRRLFAA